MLQKVANAPKRSYLKNLLKYMNKICILCFYKCLDIICFYKSVFLQNEAANL